MMNLTRVVRRVPAACVREVHLGTLIDKIPLKSTNARAFVAAVVIMSVPALYKSTAAGSEFRRGARGAASSVEGACAAADVCWRYRLPRSRTI